MTQGNLNLTLTLHNITKIRYSVHDLKYKSFCILQNHTSHKMFTMCVEMSEEQNILTSTS